MAVHTTGTLMALADEYAIYRTPSTRFALLDALLSFAAAKAEPVNHLENIYAFLCSVAPEGIADEAFREVPEALLANSVRTRLNQSRNSMGAQSGPVQRNVGTALSAGKGDGGAVAEPADLDKVCRQAVWDSAEVVHPGKSEASTGELPGMWEQVDLTSEREKFEAWIRREHDQREYITPEMDVTVAFPHAWKSWQSRAALAATERPDAVTNPSPAGAGQACELGAAEKDAARPVEPLTEQQAIQLWHENKAAHSRLFAFEWFASGILAAERAHGIVPNVAIASTEKKESPHG